MTIGGNGANAAYVAARRGARVTLHTAIGTDPLGDRARAWLKDAGCVLAESRPVAATALNVTAASSRQQRATFFLPPPAPRLPRFGGRIPFPDISLVCGWPHPALAELETSFRVWKQRGVRTALDPGPLLGDRWPREAFARALARVDLLLANEPECCALTGARTLTSALRRLRRHCPGDLVVKRGAAGAVWLPRGERPALRNFEAPTVRAVNTVGAGDTFNGALLASLLCEGTMSRSIRAAIRAASQVVASGRGVLGVRAR